MTNLQDMFDESNVYQFQKMSDETRALLSKIAKERSPDVIAKIVKTRKEKGYRHSEETRAKLSKSGGHSLGKTISLEHREKMKKMWEKQCKPIMTPKGRFASIQEAAIAYGWHQGGPIRYRLKKFPTQFYLLDSEAAE
jgi:tRNA(Ile)-lysidine synthase TilS/MesJ